MKTIWLAAALAGAMAASGCVIIDDETSETEQLWEINRMAIETCGGADKVQEVNDDGFVCREDD